MFILSLISLIGFESLFFKDYDEIYEKEFDPDVVGG